MPVPPSSSRFSPARERSILGARFDSYMEVSMNRLKVVAFVLLILTVPGVASAALINPTVIADTPTFWYGYIDWTVPVAASSVTMGATNWRVGLVEVPVGGGFGVLVINTTHQVEPHGPPNPGAFLALAFGPTLPGAASGPDFTTEPHADAPGHFDSLRVLLNPLNATTTRVDIQLTHEAAIPEPTSICLVALGGLLVFRFRSGHRPR